MFYQLSAPATTAGPTIFIVKTNESQREVIDRLAAEGFIKSGKIFSWIVALQQGDALFSSGEYQLSPAMNIKELYLTLRQGPGKIWVNIPSQFELAELADLLEWQLSLPPSETQQFIASYQKRVKDHYQPKILEALAKKYTWGEAEQRVAAKHYEAGVADLLGPRYVAGIYLLPADHKGEEIAQSFFDQASLANHELNFSLAFLDQERLAAFNDAVYNELEWRPDIIPLPAHDIRITPKNGKIYLLFSSSFWNEGRGPLELRPGERREVPAGDIEADIVQRIYRPDGSYRTKLADVFIWHEAHNHYHFRDFMDYVLEPVDQKIKIQPVRKKTSFCLRDIELIKKLENTPAKPAYGGCNPHVQGVSVGWGDTYKYNLVDQDIDITTIPPGEYRLTLEANANRKFDEIRTDNNVSHVLLYLDPDKKLVQIKS